MTTEAQRLAVWLENGACDPYTPRAAAALLRRQEEEILEQSRLNGMGAEREARLLARISEQEAALMQAREALEVATRVANCAYNTGQGSEQWESGIRPTIHEFDKTRRNAIAAINELLGEQT